MRRDGRDGHRHGAALRPACPAHAHAVDGRSTTAAFSAGCCSPDAAPTPPRAARRTRRKSKLDERLGSVSLEISLAPLIRRSSFQERASQEKHTSNTVRQNKLNVDRYQSVKVCQKCTRPRRVFSSWSPLPRACSSRVRLRRTRRCGTGARLSSRAAAAAVAQADLNAVVRHLVDAHAALESFMISKTLAGSTWR